MVKSKGWKSKRYRRLSLGISVRKFGCATWNDIDSGCEGASISSVN